MYLQELVEVAIGLVFAWLLISLATIQVQEMIVRVNNKRAKELEKAIGNILNDPTKFSDFRENPLFKQFYNHPLIVSLTEPAGNNKKSDENDNEKTDADGEKKKRKLPSYIPASHFAAVVFDIVSKAGTEKSPIQASIDSLRKEIDDEALIDNILKLGKLAANSQAGTQFQKGVKATLTEQIKLLGDNNPDNPTVKNISEQLTTAINRPDVDLKNLFESEQVLDIVRTNAGKLGVTHSLGQSLNSLLNGAEEYATSADKALALGRKNVEQWFDSVMDRMSGWYKRWAQTVAFFIGLGIAFAFNIDSIHIATELWRQPALRQTSMTYIENYVDANTENGAALSTEQLQVVYDEIEELSFPVGWGEDYPRGWGWLLKIVGFAITAGAAMLGAPFWFDILKKLVNIRSAGKNPAEKPKEETTGKA